MKSRLIPFLLLLVLALIWGSSFILMKKGLIAFDSHEVAALRIFIAFLFLLPFGIIHFKRSYPDKWKYFLAVGMFGNFIPAFLFTLAETRVSSSLAGLLNSLTPIFTLLLGMLLFGMKVIRHQIAGILVGFTGAVFLILGDPEGNVNDGASYGMLIVIATICYGMSVNIIRKHLSEINSVTTTFWAFMMVGPMAGIYLLSTDVVANLKDPSGLSSFGYIAILGVVGTAIGVILFNILIRQTSAIFASSVTYLIPIVALAWGMLDGEAAGYSQLLAITLILTGVFLINRKKKEVPDQNPRKVGDI